MGRVGDGVRGQARAAAARGRDSRGAAGAAPILAAALALAVAGCTGAGTADGGPDLAAADLADGGGGADPGGSPDGTGADPGRDGPADEPRTDGIAPGDGASDGPATAPGHCRPCDRDGDCGGGARCLPVGATRHCLAGCEDDGDCPPSFLCYAASAETRACLPVSYACVPCIEEAPCEEGRACDFVTGECRVPRGLCEPCTYDFHCGGDRRCLKEDGQPTGNCVDPCPAGGACPDPGRFDCVATARGVDLCRPRDGQPCCGCPPDRPFPGQACGTCRQCWNNTHCDPGQVCDAGTGTCLEGCGGLGPASCASRFLCADCTCRQCCADADCDPGTGPCTEGRCAGAYDPCQGQCADPYPFCEFLSGIAQCVQCLSDGDCAALFGDPACACTGNPFFLCEAPGGQPCDPGAECFVDADCQGVHGAGWSCLGRRCVQGGDSGCGEASCVDPYPVCAILGGVPQCVECGKDADCEARGGPLCACSGAPGWQCRQRDGWPCGTLQCAALCESDADCAPGPRGEVLQCLPPGGGACREPSGTCDQRTACCGSGQQCFDVLGMAGSTREDRPAFCSCSGAAPCPGDRPCRGRAEVCAMVGESLCPGGVPPPTLPDGLCLPPLLP